MAWFGLQDVRDEQQRNRNTLFSIGTPINTSMLTMPGGFCAPSEKKKKHCTETDSKTFPFCLRCLDSIIVIIIIIIIIAIGAVSLNYIYAPNCK
jgi:hypothetical protein